MLALDDPQWSRLSHAYGPAADTPGLLRTLASSTLPARAYEDEPWFSLWSSLCHQGDVYDASYAAVPHIVEIAVTAQAPIDFGFFQLPAAIEVARQNRRGPPIPTDLEPAYRTALVRLPDCVSAHRNGEWDQAMLLSAFAAQAVSKGHFRVAEAIMNLDDDLITKLIDLDFT
jgi:hypothetical protein